MLAGRRWLTDASQFFMDHCSEIANNALQSSPCVRRR